MYITGIGGNTRSTTLALQPPRKDIEPVHFFKKERNGLGSCRPSDDRCPYRAIVFDTCLLKTKNSVDSNDLTIPTSDEKNVDDHIDEM